MDSPARYQVFATVQVKGVPEKMQISEAEPGSAITYPKRSGYRIETVKSERTYAVFSIMKKAK